MACLDSEEREEMRMNFKKMMACALACVLAASVMAGCSSAPAASAPAAPAQESAASGESVFKIGVIGPLTGGAAAYGVAVQHGAEIAVEEINAAGGINGFQVELRSEDDELDNQKSVNAYNALKDWGMQMLVGSVTSGCCIAVSEYSKEDNMFQITPSGSAADCVQYDNVFRICFSDPNQGKASAQYIGQNMEQKNIGVIYDSSDVYSSGIYQTFAEEAGNQGLNIVSAEAFTSDSKTDFSVQIQKAKDAGAELVFLPIYYTEASLILQQADTIGYKPVFFGCDGMDGILGVENFDTSLAEGLMLLTPFAADAEDELTQKFVAKYQEAHGEIPNQFAADSYDAVYSIKAAAEKAGITPDMSISDMCEAMKGAIVETTVSGLTSSSMSWEASGEPNKEPKAVVIQDGAYASVQ